MVLSLWEGPYRKKHMNSLRLLMIWNSSRIPRIPHIRCHLPQFGTSLPHAPGVRMTWVLNKLPHNILYYIIILISSEPSEPRRVGLESMQPSALDWQTCWTNTEMSLLPIQSATLQANKLWKQCDKEILLPIPPAKLQVYKLWKR
jgi:hypothetical protein